jgi:hypothetical protein
MNNVYKGWTITVTQRIEDNKNKGAWIIDVEATNGRESMARNFHSIISQAMLTQAVRGWIDTTESAKEVSTDLDFTEPVAPEPAPVDTEREDWNKDREQLRVVMELVRDGVFPANDARVNALQAKVRSGFKVGYLG